MSFMAVVVPSHPYNAETEHVGFSPTRQTSFLFNVDRMSTDYLMG